MTDQKKELPPIVYFDKDPGFEKLQEIVGGYFQLFPHPTDATKYIVMREFDDPNKQKMISVNVEISKLLNYEIRGRVAIIPME